MSTAPADLYARDWYLWTLDQAAALRRLAGSRWNGPLDLEHLAEEVEDLGRTARNAVVSQFERLIRHLLKLAFARAADPRRQWILSVDDARRELEKTLTRSLRQEVETALPDLYRRERKRTVRELELFGEAEAAGALPVDCPFTMDQLLDEDWFPEPPRAAEV
jgi:hypothetical protein